MELKNLALRYFHNFSKRDIAALENMFDSTVCLQDWEIAAEGLTAVLEANQRIFDSVKSIRVQPLALYAQFNTVVAELDITVNGQEHLAVVDVIKFNDAGKIVSVRAYKG